LFNDSALSSTVNLAANVSPVSVTFSNQTQNYTINSSGGSSLGGAAQSFRKWGGFDQRVAVRCRFADDLVILFYDDQKFPPISRSWHRTPDLASRRGHVFFPDGFRRLGR
jgi:hypothetical protein